MGQAELRAPSLQWGPHQKRSGVGKPSGSRPASGREAHLGAGRPRPSPTFSPVPGSAQAFADHLLSRGQPCWVVRAGVGMQEAVLCSPVRPPWRLEVCWPPAGPSQPVGSARSPALPAEFRVPRAAWCIALGFYLPGEEPSKQNRVSLGHGPNEKYFGSGDLFLWVTIHCGRF